MCLRPKSAFFPSTTSACRPADRRHGYTLVEILVATTLTLILMTAVVSVFGGVGDGISKARRALEQFDRLRTTAQKLRMDLQGVTVNFDGNPVRPEASLGYFELIEGGILSVTQANGATPTPLAYNDLTTKQDYSVGERGDILMFTTRNAAQPFVGRYVLSPSNSGAAPNPTMQSDVAEVAWFLRGTTLHRRVLLVAPGVAQTPGFARLPKSTFFASNDISVRLVNGQLVPNSLGDLTKRENRFAHPASTFPFDARAWGLLGLPTLAECSSPSWMATWVNGTTPAPTGVPSINQKIDYWDSGSIATVFGLSSGTASPDQYMNRTQQDATRLADDVVLTNVIGFDVKVWEPAANNGVGGYVDLGYGYVPANQPLLPPQNPATPRFNHMGAQKSGLAVNAQYLQRVFDSYCFSYENEGIYNFDNSGNPVPLSPSAYPQGLGKWPPGTSTNGFDDDGNGVVDDANELITQPPYPVPLRGIQITIRCFEPDSRQVRQITIEHDFLPK